MNDVPWRGAAIPADEAAFDRSAGLLTTTVETIRAVWEVECGGRPFRADGSLTRRFEPHHMPGATTMWRDSLKLSFGARELAFGEAWQADPEGALRATSWGGPQIMGFNVADTWYLTVDQMVRAMAETEAAQINAFALLVRSWGLDKALRAQDWRTFARHYNGPGQVTTYAGRMEAAYRRIAGAASPVELRVGATGADVAVLQRALEIPDDGKFGPQTDRAVRQFQKKVHLPVDGVVGARTWAALRQHRGAVPPTKPR
jgi:hypothetical protein